jgi:hypothetical protein
MLPIFAHVSWCLESKIFGEGDSQTDLGKEKSPILKIVERER